MQQAIWCQQLENPNRIPIIQNADGIPIGRPKKVIDCTVRSVSSALSTTWHARLVINERVKVRCHWRMHENNAKLYTWRGSTRDITPNLFSC